jgi:hypothetical protein
LFYFYFDEDLEEDSSTAVLIDTEMLVFVTSVNAGFMSLLEEI